MGTGQWGVLVSAFVSAGVAIMFLWKIASELGKIRGELEVLRGLVDTGGQTAGAPRERSW